MNSDQNREITWKSGEEMVVQLSHSNSINLLCFSPDGRFLLSFSSICEIKLWDITTGLLVRNFIGMNEDVTAITFSGSGSLVAAVGGKNGFIKIWKISGESLTTIDSSGYLVSAMAFSPSEDKLLVGRCGILHDNYPLILLDIYTGEKLSTFEGHKKAVVSVGFSKDGERIFSAECGNEIRVWDIKKEKTGMLWKITGGMREVDIAGSSEVAVTYGWDKIVRVWNIATGDQLHQLQINEENNPFFCVLDLKISRDGKVVFINLEGRSILKCNLDSGNKMIIKDPESILDFTAIAYCSQNDSLATALSLTQISQPSIKIYSGESQRHCHKIQITGSTLEKCKLSADGRFISLGSEKGRVRIIDIEQLRTVLIDKCYYLGPHDGIVERLGFSGDGAFAFGGCYAGDLYLWQLPEGDLYKIIENTDERVQYFRCFIDLENSLYALSLDRWPEPDKRPAECTLWDPLTEKVAHHFIPSARDIVLPTSDGRFVLFGSRIEGSLDLWDMKSMKRVIEMKNDTKISLIALCYNGKTAITTDYDKNCSLWNLETGVTQKIFIEKEGTITFFAFSPIENIFVVGYLGGILRVYRDLSLVRSAQLNIFYIKELVFSRDGKRIVALDASTAIIIETQTWKPLFHFDFPEDDGFIVTREDNRYYATPSSEKYMKGIGHK